MTQENEVTHSTTNTAAHEFVEFTYAEAIAIAQRNMQENCPSVSRVFLARIAELEAALLAKSAAYDALVAEIARAPVGKVEVYDTPEQWRYVIVPDHFDSGQRVRLLLVREGGDA